MVVLILEKPKEQMIYFNRVKDLAQEHNFDTEYITPEILKLDKEGKCPYINCKCKKKL